MKRIYSILSILVCVLFLSVSPLPAQNDSTQVKFGKDEIGIILSSFNTQDIKEVKPKIDYLIKTAKDSVKMAEIATMVFDYYYTSNVMGDDALAIYVAENYFLNKKLKWPKPDTFTLLRLFVEYNKHSLVGNEAPDLEMEGPKGESMSLHSIKARHKILLFYEDECKVCKEEIPALMSYLQICPYKDIALIRVYTKTDRKKWSSSIAEMDKAHVLRDNVKIYDMWDPDISTGYPKLYGVLKTPRIFLMDGNDIIVGKGLNTSALMQLMDYQYNKPTENQLFFQKLFDSILPENSVEKIDSALITSTIDSFYERTKDNPALFREIYMDMYQFLKRKNNIQLQDGAAYIGYKYIASMPKMWENDSLVTATHQAVKFYYQNRLETRITDLKLSDLSGKPRSIYNSKAKYTVIYFYNMSCPVCEATAADIFELYKTYSGKGLDVLAIYTGSNKKEMKKYVNKNKYDWTNLWDKDGDSGMFSKFNLSAVPAIYVIDESKTILAKEISPAILKQVVEALLK